MRMSAKLGLTALIAALLLSTAISTASARQLSVSNTRIRVTWSRLELENPGGSITIRCRVTLEGSFHANPITKVRGTLIGAVTRADIDSANCTNARPTAEGLPWTIAYEGFRGTLPRFEVLFFIITNLLINFARILGAATECRYGTATDAVTGAGAINASSEATTLQPVAGRNSATLLERRNDGLGLCPAIGRLVGSASEGVITLLGTTTRIRVTLI